MTGRDKGDMMTLAATPLQKWVPITDIAEMAPTKPENLIKWLKRYLNIEVDEAEALPPMMAELVLDALQKRIPQDPDPEFPPIVAPPLPAYKPLRGITIKEKL